MAVDVQQNNTLENFRIREAVIDDLDRLLEIEAQCFASDRLSRRSFRRWLLAERRVFLVVEGKQSVIGYGLVLCHRGTRLARLYSLALLESARGTGLAKKLLDALEIEATKRGRLFMRLEVAKHNASAIHLYERCGYRVFGEYSDYYADHSGALRMQKTIQHIDTEHTPRATPWYQQTTDFTCGPAALMMAMASLKHDYQLNREEELNIWREATTIFMTSGHGGCHPVGLALAAKNRGFDARVYLNTQQPLFVSGVRSAHKKELIECVHKQFVTHASQFGVAIDYQDISQTELELWFNKGYAVLILISTYRLDGKKVPHWVVLTSVDDLCLYVHDPDLDETSQLAIDCQHLPIARDDFDKMSVFGKERLRTAIIIK